jgi:hypothetical protein
MVSKTSRAFARSKVKPTREPSRDPQFCCPCESAGVLSPTAPVDRHWFRQMLQRPLFLCGHQMLTVRASFQEQLQPHAAILRRELGVNPDLAEQFPVFGVVQTVCNLIKRKHAISAGSLPNVVGQSPRSHASAIGFFVLSGRLNASAGLTAIAPPSRSVACRGVVIMVFRTGKKSRRRPEAQPCVWQLFGGR